MNRRSFLKLPTLLPLIDFGSAFRSEPHHFQYESVIGTSMDLVVWSPSSRVAEGACQTVRDEIDRLASILDTRDPTSEISRLERFTTTAAQASRSSPTCSTRTTTGSAALEECFRFAPEVLIRREMSTRSGRRTSSIAPQRLH